MCSSDLVDDAVALAEQMPSTANPALRARDEAIASADFTEGQAAFAAKRSPRFTGR